MAIGYLSPDTVSLRVSQARQLVPSGGRAEAKGPQSQHIIIAVILTKLFSGCEIPGMMRYCSQRGWVTRACLLWESCGQSWEAFGLLPQKLTPGSVLIHIER